MFKVINIYLQICIIMRVIAVSWMVISDSDTPEKRHNLLEIRTEDSSVLSSGRRAKWVLHCRIKVCKYMFEICFVCKLFKIIDILHLMCSIIRVIAVSWMVISDSDTPEKRHYLLEIRTEDSSVLSSSRRAKWVLHCRIKVYKDIFDDMDKNVNKCILFFRLLFSLFKYLKWIN